MSSASPTSGYDPAWSPDGKLIAYIGATYKVDDEVGLLLANPEDTPTTRDQIVLWDIESGKYRQLSVSGMEGDVFLHGTTWLGVAELAVLVCFLDNIDARSEESEGRSWPWDQHLAYRMERSGVFAVDSKTGQARSLLPIPRQFLQMERLSSQEVALWQVGAELITVARVIPAEGEAWILTRLERSSVGRANAAQGAIGTILAGEPVVAVIDSEADTDMRGSIVRVTRHGVERIYHSAEGIAGVFGSHDGRSVAFLEGGYDPPFDSRLMLMGLEGGQPRLVAHDAHPESRISWSPCGRKIAYARNADGRIVIADVPPFP